VDPIKISQLPPIGNTIPGNTLVPVVNMTGTPDTQKATIANIANAVLSQAGNLYISAGQANVANFAGQAGSVSNSMQPNITSVGILSNLTVEGLVNLGNVSNLVIYGGSNNQVLTTDGNGVVFWDDGGTYGNSEVANYLPTFTGNVGANWVIADYFMGNAHNLTFIPGANINGAVPYASTANSVALGNVSGIGNIANINLDGSSSNILYGNGVFAAAPSGGGLPLANGNSNFDIATVDGNVTITANSTSIWTFGTDGLLTLPSGNVAIGLQYGSEAILANNTSFGVATQGNGTTFINWSDDVSNTSMLAAIYVNDPTGNAGNISLRTGSVGNANVWKFVTDGSVIFPTLTVDIHNGGNQQAQTLQFGDDTQQAIITGPTPAVDTNAQRLIIQGQRGNGTGEGGDVYFWAGDADTNGGDIKIYAGDADNVSTGYGGYINLDGGSGFDNGGQVNITGGYSANGQGGAVSVSAGQGGTDGGAININGGSATANQGGNIALQAGYGGNNGGEVRLTGGSAGVGIPGYGNVVLVSGASTWTFDNTGNIVIAGGNSVIQSIANSSLDPTLPNVSTMTLTPDSNYGSQVLVLDPTAPGHIHLRAYASSNIDEPSANIFLGGENTSFEVTSGPNNVARIHSGSNTWYFENNGNLVTPGLTGTYIKSAPGGYMGLAAMNDGGDQPAQLVSFDSNLGLGTTAISAYANNAIIQANINGDIKSWNFDNTGNLTLPGNTFAVNYANGTQVSLGGGSYGDSNVVTLLGSFGSNSISTTGNVTANNFSGNTNSYTIGYLDIPQIPASNTTLAATDGGKHYYSTTAGNLTLTIPNNATTSFATGTAISIVVQAAGNVLVNAASGVTLYMAGSSSAGNRVVGTYGMATLMKVASDTWFINGTGVY
jgi:hypothetical protein